MLAEEETERNRCARKFAYMRVSSQMVAGG